MDLCSGAGGLSNRLEQAAVARACWAVKNCPSAAEAFHLNHPQATVYLEDCSNLLERIVEGRGGIVGGPPCQGFSQLNHHRGTYQAQLKNSVVASFFSYVDFYRSRFVL